MLRDVLPRLPLAWLCMARSEVTTLPDGSEVPLHMVSSMGNAFTFPLQTILFSCIVVGCYRALGIRPKFGRGDPNSKGWYLTPKDRNSERFDTLGNFSVFGDDIIVCREAYDLVIRMLKYFGFQPNPEKSFADGPFRESCGQDYWSGYNVRGIYCQSLDSKHDTYSLINRLNDWAANHGVVLNHTMSWLFRQVRFIPVPPWESDVSGIKVPLDFAGPLRRDRHTKSIIYLRYVPRQKELSLLNVDALARIPRGFYHNPPGILLSAVGGYVRNGSIVERQRQVRYTRRISISPCWDWWDPTHSRILTSEGWRRWVTSSVWLHLGKT